MNDQRIEFKVTAPGGRLDRILASSIVDVSRNRLQKLIRAGRLQVDGDVIKKPAYTLEGGETISLIIPSPKATSIRSEPLPLSIVFENNDLLVINKDPGIVVHPSPGHESGTIVNAVLAHAPEIEGVGGERRPGIVHRLDKGTSGILLVAKNNTAHQFLQAQFINRSVQKTYTALVDGVPKTHVGRIEAGIGRSRKDRKKMAVLPPAQGREAISQYETLEQFADHTLLKVQPLTGRTHQIRVHLAFIKTPVVGDRVYGRRKPSVPIKRQFLHASAIELSIPGERSTQIFTAPLAEDLKNVLELLRSATP